MTTPIGMRQENEIIKRATEAAANVRKRDIVVNHDERSVTVGIQDFGDLVTSLRQSRADNESLIKVLEGRDRIMSDMQQDSTSYGVGKLHARMEVADFLMKAWNNLAEQRKDSMFYEFAECTQAALDLLMVIRGAVESGGSLDQVISMFRDYDNDEDAEREYYYWFEAHPSTCATGDDGPADPSVPGGREGNDNGVAQGQSS